jgi:uncharacterized protein
LYEFLEYARRGRNSWWRYLATLVLSVVLILLVRLITDPLIARSGILPPNFAALTNDPSQPIWYYGDGTVFAGGLLLSLIVSALVVQNKHFADIIGHWRWDHAATGVVAALLLAVIGTGVDYAVHPGGFQFVAGPETLTLLLVAIPQSLMLGLFAQALFSGYLTQGLLLAAKRPFVVAALVGVIGIWGAKGGAHAAGSFVTNAAMALITIRLAGIAFAWGFTAFGNLFGAVVAVESDDVLRGSPGVFTQTTPELAWLDVAVGSVLLVLLWLWISRRYPASKDPTVDVFA